MGTIVVGCGLTLAIAIPAHAGTIKASNITLQGRESYQEGWLNPNKWDAEMDAKKSELAQILTSLGGELAEYLPQDADTQIDIDSLVYIADVQEQIDRLRPIQEQAEADKKAAEEEAARKAAEEDAARAAKAAKTAQVSSSANVSYSGYSNGSGLTRSSGVNYYNGTRETYYSSRVLYHYRTGEWYTDSEGFYRTSSGYYVIAASDLPQGSVVNTSKGLAQVCDSGCAAGTRDFYVSW